MITSNTTIFCVPTAFTSGLFVKAFPFFLSAISISSYFRSVAACMIRSELLPQFDFSIARPSHNYDNVTILKISVISEEIMMIDFPAATSSFIR